MLLLSMQQLLDSFGIEAVLEALSVENVLRVLGVLLIGAAIICVITRLADRMVERSKALVPLRAYIRTALRFGLWFALALLVAESLGIHTTSLVALLGVVGLAVSLALQNTLSNVAGGIMLLVTQPFQVGDFVEADGVLGTVTSVELSYTTFATVDNKKVFLPNSQLSATKIINYTALGKRRVEVSVRASYASPPQLVRQALEDMLTTIPHLLPDPPGQILVTEYQPSAIQYIVRAWAPAAEFLTVYYAMLEGIPDAFARHGVEMTYDHLNIHLRDEAGRVIPPLAEE